MAQWTSQVVAVVKSPPANARNLGSVPGRSPGGGHGQSIPVFLPGESHGQRSLAGYRSKGYKELGMTEAT